MAASVGFLVPLVAQPGKGEEITKFFHVGHGLVKEEPGTLQWFALEYKDTPEPTFAIFDTFAEDAGRDAHFKGPIAAALVANAPTLVEGAPEIQKIDIIASKVSPSVPDTTAGLANGLRVLFTAQDGKVDEVRKFLAGALPLVEQESNTLFWYAIHFPGTAQFGIVDFFPAGSGRDDHLAGAVAAALFANVDTLLTGPPDVVFVDVLAANIQ